MIGDQVAIDRPDLTARVFHHKLRQLLKDLTTKYVLGEPVAWMHTVEFQKRGLPHAHILLILCGNDKPKIADDYDKFVSAELPNPEKDIELFKLVTRFMIHKPCGRNVKSPCMTKGFCKADFPKPFNDYTTAKEDGYPEYRRLSPTRNGFKAKIKFAGKEWMDIDNRWIIPYNPYLLKKYQAHINVEICSSIMAIKYLYKYIYKGPDKASFRLLAKKPKITNIRNEIERFYDAFYISGSEACWKLFMFKMHSRKPAVIFQKLHLENKQLVYYTNNTSLDELLASDKANKTMLTAWMETNLQERLHPLSKTRNRSKWHIETTRNYIKIS